MPKTRAHAGSRSIELTAERLRGLLRYEPDTGNFVRLQTTAANAVAGSVAGLLVAHGYWAIKVDGKRHYAHRLAWLYMTGAWPEQQIDHVNRIRHDNRWANLRELSNAGNAQNKSHKCGKSGIQGVRQHRSKWEARITLNGTSTFIGSFDSAEDAKSAYAAKKQEMHLACTI